MEKSLPIDLTNFSSHLDLKHPQHCMTEFHSLVLSCMKATPFTFLSFLHWFMEFRVLFILYWEKPWKLLSVHYSFLTLLDGDSSWVKISSLSSHTLYRNSREYCHPYIPHRFCVLLIFFILWNPLLRILVLLSWITQETLSHLWTCWRAQTPI